MSNVQDPAKPGTFILTGTRMGIGNPVHAYLSAERMRRSLLDIIEHVTQYYPAQAYTCVQVFDLTPSDQQDNLLPGVKLRGLKTLHPRDPNLVYAAAIVNNITMLPRSEKLAAIAPVLKVLQEYADDLLKPTQAEGLDNHAEGTRAWEGGQDDKKPL